MANPHELLELVGHDLKATFQPAGEHRLCSDTGKCNQREHKYIFDDSLALDVASESGKMLLQRLV